jgi:DNA-binding NtrC family response regulator
LKNNLQQRFGPIVKVSEYNSGEECIEQINHSNSTGDIPDVVILDYELNDGAHPKAIDGIKVLRKIKSISDDTVVIMLSGHDRLQIALEAVKNGAYEYISKGENAFPVAQSALKNAIENIKSARRNDTYLKWNFYMGMFIMSMILFDVIWYCAMH